jgi:hypothetical protein
VAQSEINGLSSRVATSRELGIFGYAYTPKQDAERHKSACRPDCGYFNGSAGSERTAFRRRQAPSKSSCIPFREIGRQQGREDQGSESFARAPVGNSKESRRAAVETVEVIPEFPDCAKHRRSLNGQEMTSAFSQIQREIHQDHSLRKPFLRKIKDLRGGRAVVSFFITFYGDYPLSQKDDDMIEEILVNTDCSHGITLILDAPGGDALAAERMITICRNYSGGDFEAIVAARAKSAATMVCLGADRILMSPTSELGPVDPQVYSGEPPRGQWVAAHHMIKAYDELFNAAVALTSGQIEPYLQQLGRLDAVQIAELRAATQLSENISVSSLKRAMLNTKSEAEIKACIEPFINPETTMSHGRALNYERARDCGLNVELMDLNSDLWKSVWGLYVRSNFVVDATDVAKLVETLENSYTVKR